MRLARALLAATLGAIALALLVPPAAAQQPKPQSKPAAQGPARPAVDQKRLAFNRTCVAEMKAAGARGASTADRVYKEVSNNPEYRAELAVQLPAELRAAQSEESRAINLLMACAIVVTHGWENGERDRAAFAEIWASARAGIEAEADADASRIDADRYIPVTRSVCMDELMAMVAAIEESGVPREEAMGRVPEALERFALPGAARDELLASGAALAKEARPVTERARIRATLCAAVTGAAVDGGMTDPDDLRAFWATRKSALLPPRRADENRVDCSRVDKGAALPKEPILLRNTCDFAISAGFCVHGPTPGTPSETIACEKNLYDAYEIGPRSAVLLEKVEGKHFHFGDCRAPSSVVISLAPDGKTVGHCWTK